VPLFFLSLKINLIEESLVKMFILRHYHIMPHSLSDDLEELREELTTLTNALKALEKLETSDRLQIQRFKNRINLIKTKILILEDKLLPDILA
jgi:hypothetical protein